MQNPAWPALPLVDWEPTYKTLHRWTQMLGKLRLRLSAPINHWWHCTLHFQARGLTTTPMPISDHRQLEIALDFVDHRLRLQTSDGEARTLALEPRSVADFYAALFAELRSLGVEASIWPMPVEIPNNPLRFDQDHENVSYEREQVARMWDILLGVHDVFTRSRSDFLGKCSPVHFFWGAFDLALTRFSGRRNPNPPTEPTMREAYSHEVISHGFWFGGDWPNGARVEQPVFYAYAVPQPDGFAGAAVGPAAAHYNPVFNEFLLPYEAVREAADPAAEILAFIRSTYAAGAELGRWDRVELERSPRHS